MDFQQQDSQEFLRFLLDGMSEDLCRKHSEQEVSSNTATQLGTNPTKHDGKSVQKSSSGILPMLPQSSPNASSATEFSRTAPASVFDGSAAVTIGGAVSTVSQRLREEIQSTRTDRPNSSSSLDKTLPHLKQNNNCKIGRIEKEHSQGILVAHPGRESSSKYVARLRHRSELSHDVCDSPVPNRGNNNSSSNNQENDAVMPFSPAGLSSSEKTVRTSALLKSADEGEDFSEGKKHLHQASLDCIYYNIVFYCLLSRRESNSFTAQTQHFQSRVYRDRTDAPEAAKERRSRGSEVLPRGCGRVHRLL